MSTFRFTGIYQSHVTLPDQSVVLVEPGDVVDLDFDDPGLLWEATAPPAKAPAKTPAAPATPASAPSEPAPATPPVPPTV